MRYDEFRDQLQDALRDVGLFLPHTYNPAETIDLSGTQRRWRLYVIRSVPPTVEPFHVSAKIAFQWSPIDAARSCTCEEDLLTELLGRSRLPIKTAQRLIRVDLELRAGLPYGSTTAVPGSQILGAWADSVSQKLCKLLTERKERQGRLVSVLGGAAEVEVRARCDVRGALSLTGVSVAGFRFVRIPRVWDDPDRREAEKGAARELSRLAVRLKKAVDEWIVGVTELARWIRYTPPPPGTKGIEPWFESPEEEGGPESIH